ncbi:cytochrome d ubiquinol oxidase subunit II [Bacillus aquiflavi]|uniref:Cytochrome d ubiquinol oxidase subunit II n=1 Tax=Bacillus aquiflavi TaxID=2672567 RepID=A0A6B3W1A2_9BACI|nr:cytochrome d ubiquinol oxidase subunit II [Bacillus aquiflavi]MBA4537411.1 cytochrome d ubiquinol oxidase subunit II [Bacillus aquiflavi]NEY81666.1 hypothetical protein [Bacillus aquiflavi]UAC47645.1 cytochrome d ubiquinol oxidase subunit II [Bacillus aquiflavi]
MSDALIAISIIWGIVFIYAVMGTMDFGAGFWSMIFLNKRETNAANIANRYLSPTWEVTNVFIVAVVVAIYSFFPHAAFTLGTVLLIPGSLILLLLAIRSAFLVFSNIANEYRRVLTYISGISGLLIPALLISVLPITHGNFVDFSDGKQSLNMGELFTSPNEYAFVGFAISSTLFLSALLLADYSKVSNDFDAYAVYRRTAIMIGPFTIIMAFLILFTMRTEASWLYTNIMDNYPLLILSSVFFIIGIIALFLPSKKGKKGLPRISVIAVVIQYLVAAYVYGNAHLPYIVYPEVTIESGFTDPSSFRAVFATYIVGFSILVPGFIYFWRLFMKDKEYLRQGNPND